MPGFHLYKTRPSKVFRHKVSQYYWILVSKNGRTLAQSNKMHTTKQSCVKSIKAILILVEATDRALYYDHTGKEVDLYVFW